MPETTRSGLPGVSSRMPCWTACAGEPPTAYTVQRLPPTSTCSWRMRPPPPAGRSRQRRPQNGASPPAAGPVPSGRGSGPNRLKGPGTPRLSLGARFRRQLLEERRQRRAAPLAQRARRIRLQALAHVPQLEQVLVIGAVFLARGCLARSQELLGGFGVDRQAGLHGVADRPRRAEGAHHVELVGIEQDPRLRRRRPLAPAGAGRPGTG